MKKRKRKTSGPAEAGCKTPAKKTQINSTSDENCFKKVRKANKFIGDYLRERDPYRRNRVELTIGKHKYSNMPEWSWVDGKTDHEDTFIRRIFHRSTGEELFDFFRFNRSGTVFQYRSFKEIEECSYMRENFSHVCQNVKNDYNQLIGFWKEKKTNQIANSVTRIVYYEAKNLTDEPEYNKYVEVDEKFIEAEFERHKRRRKLEKDVTKNAGRESKLKPTKVDKKPPKKEKCTDKVLKLNKRKRKMEGEEDKEAGSASKPKKCISKDKPPKINQGTNKKVFKLENKADQENSQEKEKETFQVGQEIPNKITSYFKPVPKTKLREEKK